MSRVIAICCSRPHLSSKRIPKSPQNWPSIALQDRSNATHIMLKKFFRPFHMSSASDNETQYGTEFLSFLNTSKSPYRAVYNAAKLLEENGFVHIPESCNWHGKIELQGKYYTVRDDSCLIAFFVGGSYSPHESGFAISAAHVDSPCLRIKPVSSILSENMLQVGVELYGGGIWHTWFDRDLGISGKVIIRSSTSPRGIESRIIEIDRPLMRIPNLAIHLTSRGGPDEGFKFNREDQLVPILQSALNDRIDGKTHRHHVSLLQVIADHLHVPVEDILDFDLSLTDCQPSCLGGVLNEFVFGGRLDNLYMSWTCIKGLLNAINESSSPSAEKSVWMVALFDNEEIGSETSRGAYSNLLSEITTRIASCFTQSPMDSLFLSYKKSFILSCDMAHAVHPNYSQKHEKNHRPLINHGAVIKINSNARYATSLELRAAIDQLAKSNNIPLQYFVVRNDSPCGATIGPIISTKLGMQCIDLGAPQYSMHSIREMAGVSDLLYTVNLLSLLYLNHNNIAS